MDTVRHRMGLSVSDFAKRMGCSRTQIYDIRKGKIPVTLKMQALLRSLEEPFLELHHADLNSAESFARELLVKLGKEFPDEEDCKNVLDTILHRSCQGDPLYLRYCFERLAVLSFDLSQMRKGKQDV